MPTPPGSPRICVQTFSRSLVNGILELAPAGQYICVELLLAEIAVTKDGVFRFMVGNNGCFAIITKQPWFDGTVIVVSSY
ncbi:MAG: hypothetical protein PHI73_00825 [Patescibacteria group bacterium]|nr:hypothetical protein [Patescibacteria group bacterium]